MLHLFDNWSRIAARLKAAASIALFLDFDGTLANIVDRPDLARLTPATSRVLERLAVAGVIRLSVISARDYESLRSVVAIPAVRCLGLYGWQTGKGLHLAAPVRRALADARKDLARRVEGLRGIWIEDKSYAFALHYRAATESASRRARTALRLVLHPFADTLRVVRGNKAWDVLPVAIGGKGAAVSRELAQHRADLAIYAGDDDADESAFVAVAGGISIHVGARRRSHAEFRLRNPDDVRQFLEKLESIVAERVVPSFVA